MNFIKHSYLPAAAIALIITTFGVTAQDEAATFASENVTDSIYMLRGATGFTGGNIAVSVGKDGVVVIDNGVSSVLEKLRAEITKITDKPVDYLINTHVHGDHIGNNAAFGAEGTRLVSHRNLYASMVTNGAGNGDEFVATHQDALPEITFNEEMTLNLNGDSARLVHLANAHTDGDSVVFFTNNNVIHAGDIMFNGLFPYIDTSNGGSLDGMVNALQAILKIGNEKTQIIPGHGPLGNKDDVNKNIAMLIDAKNLVATEVTAGKSDEEILAANPLEKYASFSWGFITTERMTKQVIAALREN